MADSLIDDPRTPILQVRDLHTTIDTENGLVRAVDGVSFDVYPGEVLSIVGESGCGKTMTALSILGLLPERTGRITRGSVLFEGRDLATMSKGELRRIRGDDIAMIFQDALTGLNPVYRVGDQIAEMIRAHRDMSRKAAHQRAVELLDLVGIANPRERSRCFVHEFSGGMRQRAMIAMAIALEPKILIADEPTTALDVTVQSQVLDLLLQLRSQLDMAIVLITHDLGVVAGVADRVTVMYAGQMIEEQRVLGLFSEPRHPYTWGLLRSMPRADTDVAERLDPIVGSPPNLIDPPPACRFAPRCDFAQEICRRDEPELRKLGEILVACHFADDPEFRIGVDVTRVGERHGRS